jgi:hypothetical protein
MLGVVVQVVFKGTPVVQVLNEILSGEFLHGHHLLMSGNEEQE